MERENHGAPSRITTSLTVGRGFPGLVLPPTYGQRETRRPSRSLPIVAGLVGTLMVVSLWLQPTAQREACTAGADGPEQPSSPALSAACAPTQQPLVDALPIAAQPLDMKRPHAAASGAAPVPLGPDRLVDEPASDPQPILSELQAMDYHAEAGTQIQPDPRLTDLAVPPAASVPGPAPPLPLASVSAADEKGRSARDEPARAIAPGAQLRARIDRLIRQDNPFAHYQLGRLYARLRGETSSEAAQWYHKATEGLRRLAEEGNGQAMYVLGVAYAFGRGVPQNRVEAQRWLILAAEKGAPQARRVLIALKTQGTSKSHR